VKRRLVVFPAADRDIDAQAQFIARSSLRSALRFLDAVEKSCDHLLKFPEAVARYGFSETNLRDLRAAPVRGFPNHLIFFRVRGEFVQIVRLLHGARDIAEEIGDLEGAS
jgi:toxin ParE1/3/4